MYECGGFAWLGVFRRAARQTACGSLIEIDSRLDTLDEVILSPPEPPFLDVKPLTVRPRFGLSFT